MGIADAGWAAFSCLFCDTSTVNNTYYLSNHTLWRFGGLMALVCARRGSSSLICSEFEQETDQAHIETYCNAHDCNDHHEFDMKPFFE